MPGVALASKDSPPCQNFMSSVRVVVHNCSVHPEAALMGVMKTLSFVPRCVERDRPRMPELSFRSRALPITSLLRRTSHEHVSDSQRNGHFRIRLFPLPGAQARRALAAPGTAASGGSGIGQETQCPGGVRPARDPPSARHAQLPGSETGPA